MKKFIHNVSSEVIRVIGKELEPGEIYEFPTKFYDKGTYNDALRSNVSLGKLLLSKDGTTLLSITDSLKLLDRIYLADQVTFIDQDTVEVSVQEAIEAIDLSSVGSIYSLTFQRNGTAKNRWIDSAHGINSYDCPQPIPYNSELVGIAAVNEKSNADYRVRVFQVISGSQIFSAVKDLDVSNVYAKTKTDFTPISVTAGSSFGVYIEDIGTDPKDVLVTLYFKVTSNNTGEY